MDNVPKKIIDLQKQIVTRLNTRNFNFLQMRTTASRGEAIDDALRHIDGDVLIFLDIDCIPLNCDALPMLAEAAARGVLVGSVQKANHIQNGDHLYAGPFCMGISKALWNDLGQPSAQPTERGDVGEEFTYCCEKRGRSIQLIWPSDVEVPVWPLRAEIQFGYNTVYGGFFLHAFGIRHEANHERFVARCQELLMGLQGPANDAVSLGTSMWGSSEGRESDKIFWHRFTETYDRALARLGNAQDILEFGVLDGDSIRWLMRRFPDARIVGVDISPPKDRWPTGDRIEYARLDQGDRAAVRSLFEKLDRRFDLIVEDGSHIPQHQATCLLEAMPHLRSSGLYFLEDIHSSHPDNADFGRYMSPPSPNALHVLLAFEHLKATAQPLTAGIASNLSAPGYFSPDQVTSLFADISQVEIYRRSALPLRCYQCGSETFNYRQMLCRCGVDLYRKPDSMTCIIEKA